MFRNFDNGLYGGNCLGFGLFNNGWSTLIGGGLFVLMIVLFIIIVHNKNKRMHSDAAIENLKIRYVQGEITEEEYLRRRDFIGK